MRHIREPTKLQKQNLPELAGGRVLGLAKQAKHKNNEPDLTYQLADEQDLSQIDNAFDILFEETLKHTTI